MCCFKSLYFCLKNNAHYELLGPYDQTSHLRRQTSSLPDHRLGTQRRYLWPRAIQVISRTPQPLHEQTRQPSVCVCVCPHSEHDLGYNLLPHGCIAEITKARKAQNQLLFHGTLFFVLLRATHCAGIRSMELARFRLALKGQMPRTCMGLALKIDYL